MTATSIEYLRCDISTVARARSGHPWLEDLLSPVEVAAANRLRHASDRNAYRCAHLLLRLITARRLGIDPKAAGDLEFTRRCRGCGGPHGKPSIEGAELSLSRSGTMVLVASAPPAVPIGVDIEHIPSEVFPGFDDYVLGPGESLPDGADTTRRRLEFWVAKEAALKATGHGLSVEPRSIEVLRTGAAMSTPTGAEVWTESINAPEHPELDRLNLAPVPCRPSHAAALACAEPLPVVPLTLQALLI